MRGVEITNDGAYWFFGIIAFLVLFCIGYAIIEWWTKPRSPKCDCYGDPRRKGELREDEHFMECAYVQWLYKNPNGLRKAANERKARDE
jgi:hypothetical protein